MVIIAALAVTLAFKFQRGLRPGIRLERALQMLESLMKRNLVLEAQVAELKIEKSHTPPVITSIPTPTPSATTPEPRIGSWEKAFRTPLEAGPPIGSKSSSSQGDPMPFGNETGIPPPRIEPKTQPTPSGVKPRIVISDKGPERATPPTLIISEKPVENTEFPSSSKSSSASWEDSPQYIGESKGILTPSTARRAPPVSDTGGLKQPYIPVPAPKSSPASIVASPAIPQPPVKSVTTSAPARITARPATRAAGSKQTPAPANLTPSPIPLPVEAPKPETSISGPVPPPVSSLEKKPATNENTTGGADTSATIPSDQSEKTAENSIDKLTAPTRKRLSLDS